MNRNPNRLPVVVEGIKATNASTFANGEAEFLWGNGGTVSGRLERGRTTHSNLVGVRPPLV